MKNRKYYPYKDSYIKPNMGPKLSVKEQKEMIKKIRNGDLEARTRFLESNFHYIENIAKKYATSYMSVDDLIQEGYLGYEKAIASYDFSCGNQFSTYACMHIFKAVTEAAWTNLFGFSFTRKDVEGIKKYDKAFLELCDSLGRKPTIEEIAERMGITPKSVKNIQYIQAVSNTLSMEHEVKSSKNREGTEQPKLQDCLEDVITSVEDAVLEKEMQKDVQDLLETVPISEQTKEMLILHNVMGQSSRKIGNMYGITGTTVLNHEKKAFKKLRNIALNRGMDIYLGISTENRYEDGPVMQKKR